MIGVMATEPFSSMSVLEEITGLTFLIVVSASSLRMLKIFNPLAGLFGVLFAIVNLASGTAGASATFFSGYMLAGSLTRLLLSAYEWAFSRQAYETWLQSFDSAWEPGIKYRLFQKVVLHVGSPLGTWSD